MEKLTTDQIYSDFPNEKLKYVKQYPYVGEDGIYVPTNEYVTAGLTSAYRILIPKDVFVEAYNKWIKENK